MADKIAVATKRAQAEARLYGAIETASEKFGVAFTRSSTPANRYPDLAAAENLERIAAFIETINERQK